MYLCVTNLGKWVASLKEKWFLKRREFDAYKALRELNLMNAIELLMKQNTEYDEKFFFNIYKHMYALLQYLYTRKQYSKYISWSTYQLLAWQNMHH